ncbi:META domain-containing protein [Micromonospora narathiwatensis]|uniref:META domain-containing protein n=1 Tax=Micromonospora narathiwatensis TaxID=299146 RepID=A0A1A8ZT70_9ACTN|nr:hypothetical protein [Micromonospora narathiwatensis]SBT47070.1 hypothetical protein GA0070621_2799 [Micromonospora narathiwatensis]
MSRIRYLVAAVAVGALLAGCGERIGSEGPAADQVVDPGPTALGPPQDPVALIGSWTVAEADGSAGDVLRLAYDTSGDLLLFGRCGPLMGNWRADVNGLFVADLWGNSVPVDGRDCRAGAEIADTWLGRAAAFRVDADGPVLLDDRGGTVARLVAGAKPTPGPNLLPSLAEPPEVTDEVRRAFAPAAALPAALNPAGRETLLGRWVSVQGRWGRSKAPYVELRADGGWKGSDGCNGQSGRWAAGPGGAFLGTTGPSTLIGCDNESVGVWLARAWRAGLNGDVLVFLDAQGKETGRLRRDR